MINATDDTFSYQVLKNKKPSLVLFGSKHCKPCSTFKRVLDSTDFSPFNLFYVDVEQSPRLTSKYSIMSLPTLLLFNKEKVVDQYSGKPTVFDIMAFANNGMRHK